MEIMIIYNSIMNLFTSIVLVFIIYRMFYYTNPKAVIMWNKLKKYYNDPNLEIVSEFQISNIEKRTVQFSKNKKMYEAEVLINFNTYKILEFGKSKLITLN